MAGNRSHALLVLATLLACFLGVASAQEARLPEFRKAFLKSRDPAAAYQSRLESLKIVKGLDSVAVATALLKADRILSEEMAGFDKFRDRVVRTGTINKDACETVTVLLGLQEELRTAMMSLRAREPVLHLVVDCSVSTLLEHPEGETRLGRIVGELDRAMRQLHRGQRFNIIPFEVYAGASFAKDFATKAQVPKARRWLEKRFRKRFSHNPGIIWQRYPATRYDALELAFRLAGLPATDQYYQPHADTVFVVSDGLGRLRWGQGDLPQGTPEATVRAVRRWNVNRHLVIHAVQVGGRADGLLRAIAAANGGRFVVDGR